MKRAVGLWIDHRKAVIVVVTDRGETTSLIVSRVEKQLGRYAGIRSTVPYESSQVPADDRQERRFKAQLTVFYDAVIASIRGAESVFIFGPGEAKGELKRRIEEDKVGGRIVAIETIDKMTDRQIAAKVGQHFSEATETARGAHLPARRLCGSVCTRLPLCKSTTGGGAGPAPPGRGARHAPRLAG